MKHFCIRRANDGAYMCSCEDSVAQSGCAFFRGDPKHEYCLFSYDSEDRITDRCLNVDAQRCKIRGDDVLCFDGG